MTKYLDSLIAYGAISDDLKIIKSYEGRIDQDLVKSFTEDTERYFELPENSHILKSGKKVFHVMVELLQNVCKHSEVEGDKEPNIGQGSFVLCHNGDSYYVCIGNIAKIEDAKTITTRLDEFNNLDESELKVKYRELIKASRISEKGGAGLGLIDIIKKTKNKIEYQTNSIDKNLTYFMQKSKIDIA